MPTNPSKAPDPLRCPLCGQANACGYVAGSPEPCWCFESELRLPAQLKRQLEAKNLSGACVCADCIRKAHQDSNN